MEVLILAIIFGLGISYFANQNTGVLDLRIANYVWADVPLYMIIVVSFLMGLFLAWVSSLIRSASASLRLRGKESKIRSAERTIDDLTRRVKHLERENVRLSKSTIRPVTQRETNIETRPTARERLQNFAGRVGSRSPRQRS